MTKTGQISFLHIIRRKRLLTFMRSLLRKQKTSNELKDEVGPANSREVIRRQSSIIRLNDYKYIYIFDEFYMTY